jgi:hypothetical protein
MSSLRREYGGIEVGIGHQGAIRYGTAQKDGRSELLKIQEVEGANANVCPFGCPDDELDENGYCFHLVGFSPDGRKLELNQVDADGRIRTKAPLRKVNGRFVLVHDAKVDRSKHVLVPVVKGGSCRVYENIPRPADYPEPVSDELSEQELAAIDAEEDALEAEPVLAPEPIRRRSYRRRPPVAEE